MQEPEQGEALPTGDGVDAGVIELWGRRGGMYFPMRTWHVPALREGGFEDQFMLRYTGQSAQFSVMPSRPFVSTPQDELPLQDTNADTGGKPARTTETDVMMVTVLFATGQA